MKLGILKIIYNIWLNQVVDLKNKMLYNITNCLIVYNDELRGKHDQYVKMLTVDIVSVKEMLI